MAINSDIVSYTQARANLKALMDKVWDDSTPVTIFRANGKSVVMINKDDYDRMNETEYLTASNENAKRLKRAIKEAAEGKFAKTYTAAEWKEHTRKNKRKNAH